MLYTTAEQYFIVSYVICKLLLKKYINYVYILYRRFVWLFGKKLRGSNTVCPSLVLYYCFEYLDSYNSALNSFLHTCEKSSINDQNILLNQILFSD